MKVNLIVIDIDGVFTDGTVYVDKDGSELKRISFKDIDAYFRLKKKGYKIGLITGEDTPIVDYFERRFAPDFLFRGNKDKANAVRMMSDKYNVALDAIAYCGDSRSDVEALKICGYSFVPENAEEQAKAAAKRILPARGGKGVIAALEQELEKIE